MELWTTIWTVIFGLTMLVYIGLVVVVSLGGWQDIQAMFRQLDEQSLDAKGKGKNKLPN